MQEELSDIQMNKWVMHAGEISVNGCYEAESHAATMIFQNKGT